MKILILSDDFPPQSFGGAGISTSDLARSLKEAGHKVFIITTCQTLQQLTETKKFYQKDNPGSFDGVFPIYANFHERWESYLCLYNPQTISKVKQLIEEINPDIVHAHNIHSFLSYHCLKIAKHAKKPVFFTARDTMLFTYGKLATKKYLEKLDPHVSWIDNLKEAQKRYNPLRNIIIRYYLKYVDKIFAISKSLKVSLEANKIKNVEIIYNGIDAQAWQVSPEKIAEFKNKYNLQGKQIVFFAGRISRLKGSQEVAKAMTLVQKEIPEAILLIAGTKGIGWLRGTELKAAYHASDVVVIPSLYLDPFNRTNIEGMSCKKPIIGTCFGGTPEIIQDGKTGFIVNPFNTEETAQKIILLLKNKQLARQMGEAGYARVKQYFNLQDCVNKNISWYQKYI